MKNRYSKTILRLSMVASFMLIIGLLSCTDDDEVAPAPVASFSVSNTGPEAGESITFTNESENATAFQWSFGDGNTSTEENPTHTYEAEGQFTVRLVASGEGGESEKELLITVSAIPAPEAAFSIEQDVDNLVQGQEINFINESTGEIESYEWSFGDASNSTSDEEKPAFTYEDAGNYTVTLVAVGPGGRSQEFTLDLEINPVAPTANFEVENEENLTTSLPVQFNFTGEGVVEEFEWNFGDEANSTSDEENPSFTYTEAGTYTVSLTVRNATGEDTATQDITIEAADEANFEVFFIEPEVRIAKINTDGTISTVKEISFFATALAVNPAGDKMYYADTDEGIVYEANIDGSGERVLTSDLNILEGDIAVNDNGQIIYVTDRGDDKVVAIDVASGTVTTVASSDDDPDFLLPTGIDYFDGKLYITAVDVDAESVWTVSVDGTDLTRIIDFSAGGFGYGIKVDRTNSKIYFDDSDSGNIRTADLDGDNISNFAATDDRVYGIDFYDGEVIWADRSGVINKKPKSGGERTTIATGLDSPRGLFVLEVAP
ncbi:MAG: PKD domain-containing protein [Cyclobacteriaceae bacterium]|nr:PKD domain-containing protein [Cyclobacteriaceae bacterium]MCH8515919.1 PKD domain-containing protein [Cyclobacteriaceae bacterium]